MKKLTIILKAFIFTTLTLNSAISIAKKKSYRTSKYNQRIAIIGAGPSGLMAALQLKKNGYKNVTVFEKASSVGGKVKTLNINGFKIELGAILTTSNYKTINKLAKEFNTKIEVFDSEMMIKTKQGPLIPYKGYTGHARLQSFLGAFKFLKTKLLNKEVSQAGLGNVSNQNIFLPMRKFAEQYQFTSILPPFEFALVACGYGYMDEIPAIYPLKLISVMYMAGLKGFVKANTPIIKQSLLLQNIKRINVGFQALWKKVSNELNVRLDTPVLSMDRKLISGKNKIFLTTKDGLETFDKVIISTNPYSTSKYLDMSDEESFIFSKVHTYNYNVTVFRSKKLKRQQTVYFEKNMTRDRIGHITAYMNYYKDSDIFIAYQQAQWGTSQEKIFSVLKDDLSELGVNLNKEDILLQKGWSYFPHFKENDLRDGIGERIEALQGLNGTYYTGATMSFETTESVSRYSQELIQKFFPPKPGEKFFKMKLQSL